uniref:Uncharacterized protein n=1 Tax=Cyanoderma ruficeps TaxID=181631 RepID=A0A8C3QRU6_9PASS
MVMGKSYGRAWWCLVRGIKQLKTRCLDFLREGEMGDMKPAARQRRRQGRGRADTCGANPSPGGGNPHPSSLAWNSWELAAVITAGLLLLYILLCYEDFHFHVAHVYAHLGYPNAQHILGQRYLQGAGVEKNEDMAMHWFSKWEERKHRDSEGAEGCWCCCMAFWGGLSCRQAARQGHPHSSFNLAVGTLRNMTVALEEGEVEKLLSVAAAHGLLEAQQLLENIFKSRNLH